MSEPQGVVLNPLLRLLTAPISEGVTGGSKDASKITPVVYEQRKNNLLDKLVALRDGDKRKLATHGGRVLLWAGMDGDSQASSHTPNDLFTEEVGAEIKSAWRSGYVVEFTERAFDELIELVNYPKSNAQRCDIFRIEDLDLFAQLLSFTEQRSKAWERAVADGAGRKAFMVRLANFGGERAQDSIVRAITQLGAANRIALPGPVTDQGLLPLAGADAAPGNWLTPAEFADAAPARALRRSMSLGFADQGALRELIASGVIVRWEPVTPLHPTVPGDGPEPEPVLPRLDDEPIVGMIDGGYHANRYREAIAWKLEPVLVPDGYAARQHGNKVASILVDGHLWSNQLQLPDLHCRLGLVQAVPAPGTRGIYFGDRVLEHVERAFREHPETHVWNLSANFAHECDEFEVSELGHGLSLLARAYNKLLVISAGNRNASSRIAPPADCEAAVVVSGRAHDEKGMPAGPCDVSRTGLGPEGMLKPDTSWFSEHRVLGGGTERGTSFAAPLVSRLGAHTWKNLSDPNPDLVRALLISACDLPQYSEALGFGSPVAPTLPWVCPDNAAVVAWSAEITAMQRYYWTGIRVPPSLMKGGRFVGRAKLVAILQPVVQLDGHHYHSTRLEAGLQYKKVRIDKKTGLERRFNETMIGCMNPKERELEARTYDHKWDPVRVYCDEFTTTNGPVLLGDQPTLQVYARMFWRNQFMYADDFIRQHRARVSFVVTLESADGGAPVYNEFVRSMAENVESAIVEQDIEIDAAEDDDIGDII